jgi:DNA invertase Pin-like site-specific DNA recombinase
MNSAELGAMARRNVQLLGKIQLAEMEIEERQLLIERLKAEMKESVQPAGSVRVTPGVCACVKDAVKRGNSYSEVGRAFMISKTTVSLIVNDKYKTKSLHNAR